MSDITKCGGAGCDLKDTCYRYTAPESSWQSFFVDPPIKDGKCEMYWGQNAESIYSQLKEIVNTKEICHKSLNNCDNETFNTK